MRKLDERHHLIGRIIAVPCPPPAPATSAPLPTVSRLQVNTFVFPIFGPQPGAVIELQIIKVTGDGHFVERLVSTDQITNTFDPRKDPVGGGLLLGYGFNLSNNIGFMPFLSVDFPNISVKQTFANGSFLGYRQRSPAPPVSRSARSSTMSGSTALPASARWAKR